MVYPVFIAKIAKPTAGQSQLDAATCGDAASLERSLRSHGLLDVRIKNGSSLIHIVSARGFQGVCVHVQT